MSDLDKIGVRRTARFALSPCSSPCIRKSALRNAVGENSSGEGGPRTFTLASLPPSPSPLTRISARNVQTAKTPQPANRFGQLWYGENPAARGFNINFSACRWAYVERRGWPARIPHGEGDPRISQRLGAKAQPPRLGTKSCTSLSSTSTPTPHFFDTAPVFQYFHHHLRAMAPAWLTAATGAARTVRLTSTTKCIALPLSTARTSERPCCGRAQRGARKLSGA
jgi:hypothetical protein